MRYILNKIKEFDTIIIHGHVRPDGDCIGSQYGLKYLIEASFPNKTVIVTGTSSDYVSFIGSPIIIEDESIFENALSICVDCATKDRLSDTRYDKAKYSIKIDHHPDVDQYCDYQYVDSKAAACAQIITEFASSFPDELKITKEAAISLYSGIYTDTDRFKFDSVSSKTFEAASKLMLAGVDLNYIDSKLIVNHKENIVRLTGYCLSNFKTTENGFAYLLMKKEIMEEYQVTNEEAAAMVSSLSTIEGCPVWAIFMDYQEEIRIRLRSRGPVINTLAEEFGGGGHAKASGARLSGWNQLNEFLIKADDVVKKYKLEENY